MTRAVRLWACSAVASIVLLLVVGALGPSAAVLPLSGRPQDLAEPWTVTVLMWAAALLAWLAVAAGLTALRTGWRPSTTRLLAAGLAATAALLVVPPLGNGDIGSYAAYGRIAVLGGSPYTSVPSDWSGDPVVDAVEPPWEDQASVYGPVATGVHVAAAWAAQDSREGVLRLIALLTAGAFAAVALVLHRVSSDKARAHVLWTCNPLLLLHLVASAHVDAFLTLALLAALVGRRSQLMTGLSLALALCVKVTAGISLVALVVAERARGVRAALVAVVLTAVLYVVAGGADALRPVLEARSRVSGATPWRWVASLLELQLPFELARGVVTAGVLLLGAALLWVLLRELPPGPGVVRTGSALWLAYLLAASYQLGWYDAVGYAYLALLAASRWDRLLVAHTAVLTLAYLPGRIVPLPETLEALLPVVRSGLCPAALLVIWWLALRPAYQQWRTTRRAGQLHPSR